MVPTMTEKEQYSSCPAIEEKLLLVDLYAFPKLYYLRDVPRYFLISNYTPHFVTLNHLQRIEGNSDIMT